MHQLDMAVIGPSRDTKPERIVRMWLVKNRIKHLRNVKVYRVSVDFFIPSSDPLFGRPVAVFVDGRFWHCARSSKALLISEYWRMKIAANSRRDERNNRRLNRAGVSVVRIWDDSLKGTAWQARLSRLLRRPFAS